MSDAIVVGGGIAGLIAARELRSAGWGVAILEARERLGGRLLYRAFAGTDREIELGGAWFSLADMAPLAREVARYDVATVCGAPATAYRFLSGGAVRDRAPVPLEEGRAFERALYELGAATRRLPADKVDDLDVSAGAWLSALELPRATHEFLLAWAAMYGGCDPDQVSFLALASDIAAFGYSAFALFDGISEHFANGSRELVQRLTEDAGQDVRLSAAVRRIEHTDTSVRVHTTDGQTREAAAAIVAVPINALSAIELEPAVDPRVARVAATGQPCQSIKVWALVEGVPAGALGVGWGPPLQWLGAVDELDGAQLMVGFGHDRARLDPTVPAGVEAAIRCYFPEASVLAVDSHDWVGDPFSRGAWGMWRPGWVRNGSVGAFQRAHGRIVFAGSDMAPEWPGWIAGAISSGRHAASLLTSA